MINLCLVVIATQFSETKRRETAKMKAERARFQSSSTLSSFTTSETTNCYRQILKLIAHLLRKSFNKSRKAYKAMRSRRLAKKEQELMEKKGAGKLQNYNVMKNVSTHSIISAPEGKKLLAISEFKANQQGLKVRQILAVPDSFVIWHLPNKPIE